MPRIGRVELYVVTRRGDYRAYFATRYGPAVHVRHRYRTATVSECASAETYSVSADGRTLSLHWATSGSVEEDHVELAEFPDRVVVGPVQRGPTFPPWSSTERCCRSSSPNRSGPGG